jgi:hypothetical protein
VLALQVPEGLAPLARVADFQPALEVDDPPDQGEGFQLAQVVDFPRGRAAVALRGRAGDSRQVLVVDSQQVPVGGVPLAQVVDFPPVRAAVVLVVQGRIMTNGIVQILIVDDAL